MTTVIIAILLIILGYLYYLYTTLIKNKNKVLEALSCIDVQIKKRIDLLPNVLKIAQKFMSHEKNLIEEVTQLRVSASQQYNHQNPEEIKQQLDIANQLKGKIQSLLVSVENYPELKSDKNMILAQQTFNEIEEQIAAARRFYNATVNRLNNSVQIFPGNIIAPLLNISPLPFFESDVKGNTHINPTDYFAS